MIRNIFYLTLCCIFLNSKIYAYTNKYEHQSPPPVGLSCNGNVNLTLNASCAVPLTRQLTLVNGGSASAIYTFDIKNGTTSLGNIATATMAGKQLQFVVQDNLGNSCWGNLLVEDKNPPNITCPAPTTLFCDAWESLNVSTSEKQWTGTLPTGLVLTDNCSTPKLFYSDHIEYLPCSNLMSAIVHRSFRATDNFGNTNSCIADYYIQKRQLTDVTMPADFSIECDKANNQTVLPSQSGFPSVNNIAIGAASTNSLCGFAATYSDAYTSACGNTFKIIRQWYVTDCNGTVKTSKQIITVQDNTAPIFLNCDNSLLQVAAASNACKLDNFTLDFPKVSDNCDPSPTVTVRLRKGSSIVEAAFPFQNVPIGNYDLEFTVTDQCGNSSVCLRPFRVADIVPPTMACDQNTKVSLGIDGTTILPAINFDNGSTDNCCLDPNTFMIKRMGEEDIAFAKDIKITCKDSAIMVVVRVSDCNANHNTCMVNVLVEDKINPVIVAQDTTVFCGNDTDAFRWLDWHKPQEGSLLQYPSAAFPGWYENAKQCGYQITFSDKSDINNCGTGAYNRTWSITDQRGLKGTYVQKYISKSFFDYKITFPKDLTWASDANCTIPATSTDVTGTPIVSQASNSCAQVAWTYKDEEIDAIENSVCYRIKRIWQTQNICEPMATFTQIPRANGAAVSINYNNTNKGAFEYIQYISIIDKNPPAWSNVPDVTLSAVGKDCKAKIRIAKPEAQDCSPDLAYQFMLHKADGTLVKQSDVFPNEYTFEQLDLGKNYYIIYQVSDKCGNYSIAKKTFLIKDALKPTPLCHQRIATSLGNTGTVMINANALNAGSYDNCTPSQKLIFKIRVNPQGTNVINPDTLPTMHTFKCKEKFIPVGSFFGYIENVQLWVGDEAGNWDFCETAIEIQDNNFLCNYIANEMRAISGYITTEENKPVSNVKINMEGLYKKSAQTPNTGLFSFLDLPIGGHYTISATKEDKALNGVSTYDLLLLNKHILGTATLKTPYQHIAADVNKSGHISTADIVELRKLILGLQSDFSKNKAWRFIDKQYTFVNPTQPLHEAFPENVALKGLQENSDNQAHFIAVKVGDLNGNASIHSLQEDSKTRATTTLLLEDKVYTKNEIVTVHFAPIPLAEACQYTLKFDKNQLQFIDIQGNKNNIGIIDNQTISVSQDKNEGFALQFLALKNGQLSEHFQLNSSITTAEAYINNMVENLQVQFKPTTQTTPAFVLYQNEPNPMQQSTWIRFQLPKATEATLHIMDTNGKIVFQQNGKYEKGQHQIKVERHNLPAAGIYYYQLSTSTQQQVRKLLIVE
jgi:hypothetical protein